ncbi:uncharacterized protein LOC143208314 isoform X2 [Lasioglossum baleicum]|uniref:uncharacterized protein LOC143208314 isoform X2 n=1 Tax=Lasioglossum baleicum TaxID=434251 RepID=UPI003FCE0858
MGRNSTRARESQGIPVEYPHFSRPRVSLPVAANGLGATTAAKGIETRGREKWGYSLRITSTRAISAHPDINACSNIMAESAESPNPSISSEAMNMVSTEETDTDSPTSDMQPPAPKKMCTKKFVDSWLSDPSFMPWLAKCEGNPYEAKCLVCNKTLQASRYDLSRHSSAKAHLRYMAAAGMVAGGTTSEVDDNGSGSNTVLPPTNTTTKAIKIATQSLVRPHITNIAPAAIPQQQQRQPKTLQLKRIPLEVKQVALTTTKMPPKQPIEELPHNIVHQKYRLYVHLSYRFSSLLDSEQFVDVTLACEGRALKCHKMILSSCSDYLAELLRENPCQHPIILMKDLKFWEVEALVKFMYHGEVNVAHDKLPQLLKAAEALQVKGLVGPNPSSQNPEPPILIPQSKPATAQSVPLAASETKEKASTSGVSTPSSPKPAQKQYTAIYRLYTESIEPNPFKKIRLQRPVTPTSPTTTVKMELLDIPLSPTIIPENNEDSSNPSNFEKLMSLHEDDDPGGNEITDGEREMNFYEISDPLDINDSEDQMESSKEKKPI